MWSFLTITATIIDSFIAGGTCAISLYSGKSAIRKKVTNCDKNSKN